MGLPRQGIRPLRAGAAAFWVGIMLVLIFSVKLEWLPTGRRGGLDHYILPSIALGWIAASAQLRLVRSAMLEVLDSEFVKLARAKGVSNNRVIWKHALHNALNPAAHTCGTGPSRVRERHSGH
ncbi:MAG: ABC transporter permease [SAR202 cluster bacterium]|nr:ABC transporter permease [SAR202 cluster bacterium]MDP7104914.1 ABC transporter permease [SAR202 cluster bacterium]MDP7226511.1 ABC transporter permease [SAR202 cluster bacterium]MDP7414861.1 ABC transporter permease [SAR202 cluster bacterium]HJO83525.1 ABC transporter permease [SAR202 cluster bacterium]